MVRLFAQIKDIFVRQDSPGLQSFNRRYGRLRTRCHDKMPGFDNPSSDRNRIRSRKAGSGTDNANTQPLEPLLGVMWREGGDHAANMILYRTEIDVRLLRLYAEGIRLAKTLRHPGGLQQRLGRHAARVQTF